MKKTGKWIPYLVFIGAAFGAGFLSYVLSARGMKVYSKDVVKPPLTPPDAVFPIVWTILYAFMGIGEKQAGTFSGWRKSPRSPGALVGVLKRRGLEAEWVRRRRD